MKIRKPVPLIDKAQVLRNIKTMADKATACSVNYRPHFKTHVSAGIGELFRQFNVSAITVSSVDMAKYFAENGWEDIMVCMPINIQEVDRLDQLTEKTTVHVLADSLVAVQALGNAVTRGINVWVDIDVGYKRTGIASSKRGYPIS